MAVQQPPAAPVAPGLTPTPPRKKSGCAGCGAGCLGCLGVFVVVVLLLVGGGWYFFVIQAQAGVPAPAGLIVDRAPIDVRRNHSRYPPPVPGEALTAGSTVPTGRTAAAVHQLPDRS